MSLGTYLNGGTVSQLRGLAFLSLSDTGTWLSSSGTSDSGGGRGSVVWGTTEASIPCRVDPLTGSEALVAEKLDDRSTHSILTLPQLDVGTSDRFEIDTETYEITAIRDRTGESLRVFEAVKLET